MRVAMVKVRYSPTIDRSHEGAVDQDQAKVYPDRCVRKKRNCPQCQLEGKIQCAPRDPVSQGSRGRHGASLAGCQGQARHTGTVL